MRLAQVVAARVERTAQRADRAGIGRTRRHVLGFEGVLADAALDRLDILPTSFRLARDIVFSVGRIGDRGRSDERHRQRHEGRQRLRRRPEQAVERRDRDDSRNRHRADADRIDVVEMRALEFHLWRTQAERPIDDEVGHQRADPGNGDVGIERKRLLQRLVDADLHQQQRHQHVEDQPHHAAGMVVGQPREEIRPGDRAGISVGDVDLELRQDHESAGQGQREIRLRQHVAERLQIHVRRLGGVLGRYAVAQREIRQERSGEQFQSAEHDPAGAGADQRDPPGLPRGAAVARQEAQEVDLFADLRHQREHHRRRGAEQQQIEMARGIAMLAGEFRPFGEGVRVSIGDRRERDDVEHDPQRLRPQLEAADQRDAVGDQRDDDDRADEIADRAGNAEAHLQRGRQDHRLDREEDEGEGGVDQRGDGRADIAEAGAPGQQIDVDAAFCGMIGDRQAAAEDDDADDEDRGGGVGDAVVKRNGAADRFQSQERDRAERGVGDAGGGPAPRALGGEAQRVVFQRLVGNPLIVLAPDAVYPLPPCHFP